MITNRILKTINSALNLSILLLALFLIGLSSYAIWDNQQVYLEAENTMVEIRQFKPLINEETSSTEESGFSQLKAINDDVCGWITVDGTAIDYPIVQGPNNDVYMNKDVYGNFSLAGSIFLDYRSNYQFNKPYAIVYGHHMDNHLMFGDLDLYKDYEFFEVNRSATIVTEKDVKEMAVLAVLEIPDSTQEIFNPKLWGRDLTQLGEYIQGHAIHIWDDAMTELMTNPTTTQAVSLVTCSMGTTGMRTVVILIAHNEYYHDDDEPDIDNPHVPAETPSKPSQPTGDTIFNSYELWICILFAAAIALYWDKRRNNA